MMGLDVIEGERGAIRVLALDIPQELLDPLALAGSLGVSQVDMRHVELIRRRDLQGLGLAGYLVEGLGVPEAEVVRADLDVPERTIVILLPGAVPGPARLSPLEGTRFLGLFHEAQGAPSSLTPLESESARPRTTRASTAPPEPAPAPPSASGMPRWVVPVALVLAALAVAALSFGGGA